VAASGVSIAGVFGIAPGFFILGDLRAGAFGDAPEDAWGPLLASADGAAELPGLAEGEPTGTRVRGAVRHDCQEQAVDAAICFPADGGAGLAERRGGPSGTPWDGAAFQQLEDARRNEVVDRSPTVGCDRGLRGVVVHCVDVVVHGGAPLRFEVGAPHGGGT
jgi:hypothetical protein